MRATAIVAWGALLIVMGVGIFAWVAYNVLVEMQPEAKGKDPVLPSSIALGMIGVGASRIRSGLRAAQSNDDS